MQRIRETAASTPATEAEVVEAVRAAGARRTPLAIEGGGTKAGLGRPAQAAETLSLRRLSGIVFHEPAELVVRARAGTPLAEVEAVLAACGQGLTFEPMDLRPLLGSGGEPTIGGVAAANLSGPRRIHAGAARDALIGVRFVNGHGEALSSGGRVVKNVTGLDLVKLQCGAYGTLGVLTEVTFKVFPRAERVATLALAGLDDARAVAALSAALGSPFEATGAAHLPRGDGGDPRTLVRIEGFADSVAHRLGALRRLLEAYGPAETIDGEASSALWRSVRDADPVAVPREAAVWRLSLAPSNGPRAVARIKETLAIRHFYDWGGGLVWLACDAAGDAGASAVRGGMAGLGGHATLVRAPAEVRAAVAVFQPLGDAVLRLTAGLKAAFDPDRVLNPGRMHAGI